MVAQTAHVPTRRRGAIVVTAPGTMAEQEIPAPDTTRLPQIPTAAACIEGVVSGCRGNAVDFSAEGGALRLKCYVLRLRLSELVPCTVDGIVSI